MPHHTRQEGATWVGIFKKNSLFGNNFLYLLARSFVVLSVLEVPFIEIQFCGAAHRTFVAKVSEGPEGIVIQLALAVSPELELSGIVFADSREERHEASYSVQRLLPIHLPLISIVIELLY